MNSGIRSRLAHAIAASVSADGRTVDRERLASVLGVAGEDDPLVVLLDAACLSVEAKNGVEGTVRIQTEHLDRKLEAHLKQLSSILERENRRMETTATQMAVSFGDEAAKREKLVRAMDGHLDELAVAQVEVCNVGDRIRTLAVVLPPLIGKLVIWRYAIAFACGVVAGAMAPWNFFRIVGELLKR